MPSIFIPPTVHTVIVMPSLVTKKQAESYLHYLIDYLEVVRAFYVKFRFGSGAFKNKVYQNFYQNELLETERYISEVEKKIENL